jgi:maleate isomerase
MPDGASGDALTPAQRFVAPSTFIGFITPSANTVVERVTLGILRDFPGVSPHFARTSVVGSHDPYPETYDLDSMLGAARALADAHLDVIAWNGSKAGSIAFDLDRDLVARIEAITGAPATTSVLAIADILRADGIRRIALVCPYVDAYRDRVVDTFRREGYECVAARNAGLSDNLSFARIGLDAIATMLRDVAASRPDAILTFCTNFAAAPIVAEMEDELGVPIYDTVTMGVWGALRRAGVDTRPGRAWGRVFARERA